MSAVFIQDQWQQQHQVAHCKALHPLLCQHLYRAPHPLLLCHLELKLSVYEHSVIIAITTIGYSFTVFFLVQPRIHMVHLPSVAGWATGSNHNYYSIPTPVSNPVVTYSVTLLLLPACCYSYQSCYHTVSYPTP